MKRVTTNHELRAAVSAARERGDRVALVPTMGALHAGHLELVRLARRHAGFVVVSIFVNPTQFDRPDDLAAYPRDLEGDEAALEALGEDAPDLVYAPDAAEVYPRPPLTRVVVRGLTDRLCGASRPGHFDGVGTVVTKLVHLVRPDVAVFGRKDFQQLQIVRRIVADLDLPVEILPGPTVREEDGVALSSRNRRLSPEQRVAARALSRALRAGVEAARGARGRGEPPDADVLREVTAATLGAAPEVTVDYVDVVDPDTLRPPDRSEPPSGATSGEEDGGTGTAPQAAGAARHLVIAVAAFVGEVRLIDNVEVGDLDDEARLLEATA